MLTVALSLALAINPAIARNMVVWEEQSRVYANGVPVAPELDDFQVQPDVAELDGFYFVVWMGRYHAFGRIVSEGRTLGPIVDLGQASQQPAVAAGAGGFVVVMRQIPNIDVIRVSPIGNILSRESFKVTFLFPPPTPKIACNGNNCAIAWYEATAPNGCSVHSCKVEAEVRAKRLGGDPIDIARVDPSTSWVSVAVQPDGDFVVAWSAFATNFALIEGDHVVQSNVTLPGTGAVLDWNGEAYVMARQLDGDVIGTRIANEWDVSDFTIAASPGMERTPDLSWPLVVYEREGMILTRDLSPQPRRRAERFR